MHSKLNDMGRLFLVVVWSQVSLDHARDKHGVTERELMELFQLGVVVRVLDTRIAAYGETVAGRLLTAILEERPDGLHGITARKMERRERREYVAREGYDD